MDKNIDEMRADPLGGVWQLLAEANCSGGAVYAWSQGGLIRRTNWRGGSDWTEPPMSLEWVPKFKHIPVGQSISVSPAIGDAWSTCEGYHVHALRFRGQPLGIFLTNGVLADSTASVVTTVLAAHLYADACEAEISHLKDAHDAYANHAETLAATGMLSAGVAHELNNPLNVVLGLSRMLESNPDCSEQVRQDASVIVSEASRAVRVVKQLLSYGRGGGVATEAVNVSEIIESAVSAFEASEARGALRIERTFESGEALAEADAFRLHRAIVEVLENAYQAVLRGQADEQYIGVELRRDADQIMLSVVDNGAGIPPDILPRIFDPFFTTRETGTGTGMGLALVHKTVRDIGGKVSCENLPGGGAKVTLSIPSLVTYS